MNFILNNKEHFHTNSSVHSTDTGNKPHFHRTDANFACFQRRAFSAGINFEEFAV
jgi:hypothetical protein